VSRSVLHRVGCLALASLLTASACAQSAPHEWKLSTALGPAYPQGRGGEAWAQLVKERSGGRLSVKHYPGATLVQRDPAREFAALRDGAVDLAVASASNWGAQVKELNLIALPWLFSDTKAVERALAGEVGTRLAAALETAGVVPLAAAPDAFRELATRRAVHAPADLAGQRLRAQLSPLLTDTLLALGALPASMGTVEARAALAQGTLDGELISVGAFEASRLYANGIPHLLLWGGCADALFFVVSRKLWDALPESDRDLLRQTARDAAHEAAELARRQGDDDVLARLARDGAKVTRLTQTGKAPFQEKSRRAYDKWASIVGEDLVRAAEAAAR